MASQIDPYTRGFLRVCYDARIPEHIATAMLVKAAAHNCKHNIQVPVNEAAHRTWFTSGRHVARLMVEKQAGKKLVEAADKKLPAHEAFQNALRRAEAAGLKPDPELFARIQSEYDAIP